MRFQIEASNGEVLTGQIPEAWGQVPFQPYMKLAATAQQVPEYVTQPTAHVFASVAGCTALAEPLAEELHELLAQTNGWVDCLTEQIRQERSGQLAGVNKLCLPGVAGGVLACGWRVELQVKLGKELNRQTNAALFAPES